MCVCVCVCVCRKLFGAFFKVSFYLDYCDSLHTVILLLLCMDVLSCGCLAALQQILLVLHWSLCNKVSYLYGDCFKVVSFHPTLRCGDY